MDDLLVMLLLVCAFMLGASLENDYLHGDCLESNKTLTVEQAEQRCAWIKTD